MQPPALWCKYCEVLGVPRALQAAWWAAMVRSRRPATRALAQRFQAQSRPGTVDTQSLWQEVCGPAPMVRRLEESVESRLMFRRTATALTEYILRFSVVEGQEDWRGVTIPRLRWYTEDEAKERQHDGTADVV
jgi:hypothetical protein